MTRNEEFDEVRSLRFPTAQPAPTSGDAASGEVGRTRPPYGATATPATFRPPEHPAETTDSLSTAAVLLLERLSPPERAVLVLREMLGCDLTRTASAIGRSETTCRRLAAAATAGTATGSRPWPRRITGADRVARVLAAIVPALLANGITMRPQNVSGTPGAVFHDPHGTLLGALALDVLDHRVHTIHWLPARRALDETGEGA